MISPEILQIVGIHAEFLFPWLKFFFSQTGWQIFKQFCRNVLWITLYQIPSSHVDLSKNMAVRGRGYFALYGYSENFKNLLLRKCMADFQIIV